MRTIVSELARMSRFGVVGLLASVVHVLVAGALLAGVPQWHEVAVNLLAYGVAFIVSLLGHQWFTFRKRARFLRFLLMSWFSLAVNNLVLLLLLKLGLSGLHAIVPAVVSAAGAGYLLARCWVFGMSASR